MIKRDDLALIGRKGIKEEFIVTCRDMFYLQTAFRHNEPVGAKTLWEAKLQQQVFDHYYLHLRDHVADLVDKWDESEVEPSGEELVDELRRLVRVLSGLEDLHPNISEFDEEPKIEGRYSRAVRRYSQDDDVT